MTNERWEKTIDILNGPSNQRVCAEGTFGLVAVDIFVVGEPTMNTRYALLHEPDREHYSYFIDEAEVAL
jgi:hypothetical protein